MHTWLNCGRAGGPPPQPGPSPLQGPSECGV